MIDVLLKIKREDVAALINIKEGFFDAIVIWNIEPPKRRPYDGRHYAAILGVINNEVYSISTSIWNIDVQFGGIAASVSCLSNGMVLFEKHKHIFSQKANDLGMEIIMQPSFVVGNYRISEDGRTLVASVLNSEGTEVDLLMKQIGSENFETSAGGSPRMFYGIDTKPFKEWISKNIETPKFIAK